MLLADFNIKASHTALVVRSSWCWLWWHAPFIPTLRRKRLEDLREFCLVYRVRSRTSRATQRTHVSKNQLPPTQKKGVCAITKYGVSRQERRLSG